MAIFNPQVNPSGLDISNCNGNGIPNSPSLQLLIGTNTKDNNKKSNGNIKFKPMTKIYMQDGNRIFPATIYERDQLQYKLSKIVSVYAVTTVGIALDCFGWLQCFLLIRTKDIMETETIFIYGHYKDNMELEIEVIKVMHNTYKLRIL
eukprot:459318_1